MPKKKKLTRKQRKIIRRGRGRKPKQSGLTKEEDKLARDMGRLMTKIRLYGKEYQTKKHHCNKCGRNYCVSGNTVIYCGVDTCHALKYRDVIIAEGGDASR